MIIWVLIICTGLGIAAYHLVVMFLDILFPEKPKQAVTASNAVTSMQRDAKKAKRRMDKTADRYNRLRGIV